jgi:hypothetical protein
MRRTEAMLRRIADIDSTLPLMGESMSERKSLRDSRMKSQCGRKRLL